MKKLLSLLLIICSIGVAYADDKSTVTSLKYVTDELNTHQDKFGANDGKAMTFTNAAGGNLPRDVKASLGTSTSDNGLPTVSAVNTGLENKQDTIGAVNTNTVVTYTGTPGTLGQKGIYQDTGTYATQSDNLIQASTFNAALRNGLNNEFVCADRDPVSNQCWLWTIDNETDETITGHGKNLFDVNTMLVENKAVRAGGVSADKPLGSEMDNNNWNCTDYISVLPDTTYTYTIPRSTNAAAAGTVFYSDKSVDGAISGIAQSSSLTRTFTTPPNCRYVRFSWQRGNGNDVQLELGSTATPYEPYTEETVNLYIPQNQ